MKTVQSLIEWKLIKRICLFEKWQYRITWWGNWKNSSENLSHVSMQRSYIKSHLATAGQQSWKQEDIFSKKQIRRVIIAMSARTAFIGTNIQNPFSYQKFGLNQVTVYRKRFATAGTTMSTREDKRLCFNTLGALVFIENVHGIPLADFSRHRIRVFYLTGTQKATHDFFHPELTNSSLSVQLKFSAALPNNTEILFLGEKYLTVYIHSARNVSNNALTMS